MALVTTTEMFKKAYDGGYAIGAAHGVVYIRAEYPIAVERLQAALEMAREEGLLGKDIFGSGFGFDIEIRIGAGAFVCGEETALMASVEGQRGEPRQKPPFPFQSGLFGKPTIINNVETLATVPAIMLQGADWFRQFGTEKSPGTKVFAGLLPWVPRSPRAPRYLPWEARSTTPVW